MVFGWAKKNGSFLDGKMHFGEEVNPSLKPKSATITVVTIKKKTLRRPL